MTLIILKSPHQLLHRLIVSWGRHHHKWLIKVNVANYGTNWHHVLLVWCSGFKMHNRSRFMTNLPCPLSGPCSIARHPGLPCGCFHLLPCPLCAIWLPHITFPTLASLLLFRWLLGRQGPSREWTTIGPCLTCQPHWHALLVGLGMGVWPFSAHQDSRGGLLGSFWGKNMLHDKKNLVRKSLYFSSCLERGCEKIWWLELWKLSWQTQGKEVWKGRELGPSRCANPETVTAGDGV